MVFDFEKHQQKMIEQHLKQQSEQAALINTAKGNKANQESNNGNNTMESVQFFGDRKEGSALQRKNFLKAIQKTSFMSISRDKSFQSYVNY